MSDVKYALGAISAEQFLSEYWQKKPLLIKQALPEFISPLSPEEIAGLACDNVVESRLITLQEELPQWQLQTGPFNDETFLTLPRSGWTLHVQGLEQLSPEIYALLDYFRFIPNWRIDDVMVSYSPDQGSAGPHFDQYDVFLLQGQGKKHWRVGQHCDHETATLANCELSILTEFHTADEWQVEQGDVLYIPPGIAHYGTAIGDSITYSIGFRAPSHGDLVGEFSHYLASTLQESQRYTDPELCLQNNPGEITPAALHKVQQILHETVNNPTKLAHWFGQYMTEPRQQETAYEFETFQSPEQLMETISQVDSLCWLEGVRCAWVEQPAGIDFFINGKHYHCATALKTMVELLSSTSRISMTKVLPMLKSNTARQLLFQLFNEGYFYVE